MIDLVYTPDTDFLSSNSSVDNSLDDDNQWKGGIEYQVHSSEAEERDIVSGAEMNDAGAEMSAAGAESEVDLVQSEIQSEVDPIQSEVQSESDPIQGEPTPVHIELNAAILATIQAQIELDAPIQGTITEQVAPTQGNISVQTTGTIPTQGNTSTQATEAIPTQGDTSTKIELNTTEQGIISGQIDLTISTQGNIPSTPEEDLTYTREDTSRQAEGAFSYESSPVQMQFGEERGIQYPCIYIKSSKSGLEKHRLMALQNIVKSNNAESRLPLYLDVEGSLMKLGSVDNKSLKTLLSNKLFSTWGITIKADDTTEYDDDMRLAYCSI